MPHVSMLIFIFIALTGAGYLFTRWLILYAHRKQLLDIANHRSSHTLATPRIGGLGFVTLILAILPAYCMVQFRSDITDVLYFIVLPALIVATTGLVDDLRGLSRRLRFALYFVSALLALGNLKLPGDTSPLFAASFGIFIAFAMSWLINLFNFMDGIDGIAGSEAVFLLAALAWFFQAGHDLAFANGILLCTAPILGFLICNWQPARIFMGDIGSTFLGCFIGSLLLYAINQSLLTMFSALILTAGFWVDATWTLGYRIVSGQRWYQAHRSHSYQILSRKFGSHQLVSLGLVGINVAWLFPLAVLAHRLPSYALLITTISLLPLIGLCFIIGAGKSSSN